MGKKIIITSGSEIRHRFLSAYLAKEKKIKILLSLQEKVKTLKDNNDLKNYKIFKKHLKDRDIIEKKYFKEFLTYEKKYNIIKVKKGYCDSKTAIEKLKRLKPDFIITFGCSIIKENFINKFKDKIINIHLGLSPYYRGSGTNFFPFVFNELQFLGSTIMKIDKGIDTGKIITQVRPNLVEADNIHTVGNKIIFDTVKIIKKILLSKKKIKASYIVSNYKTRIFKNKDFNIKILKKAQTNLKKGMIKIFLKNKKEIEKKYKIITRY